MAATLEVNYFNSFWLKKIKSITEIETVTLPANASTAAVINLQNPSVKIGAGQIVTNVTAPWAGNPTVTVVSVAANNQDITISSSQTITLNDQIKFTGVAPDANIPQDYDSSITTPSQDWYIEEARIRGGYNNTTVDFGVKAYLVEDTFSQQHRLSSLIYSGIFNSRTGINDTNQFSVGQDITRSADPANGSIQRLYAEDTNLIIFQEDKVSRALIDKDAIYSAEGNASITSTKLVIGQIIAYAGEYGISTDPNSFAVYGYRKYFTDKKRGAVLRLSRDGMTEISSYGMHDHFRDELSNANNDIIVGGWDNHSKNYVISIQDSRFLGTSQTGQTSGVITSPSNNVTLTLNSAKTGVSAGMHIYSYDPTGQTTGVFYGIVKSVISTSNPASFNCDIGTEIPASQDIIFWNRGSYKTTVFDESVLGWTSFFDYRPSYVASVKNNLYTFLRGNIYLHNVANKYGTYYGIAYPSTVTLVLNSNPSIIKNFKTINYEGSDGWALNSMTASSGDVTFPITEYIFQQSLSDLENAIWSNSFKKKENKYFANIINNSASTNGEVIFGQDMSGIKGFFSTVKMTLDNATYFNSKKELFAVSSTIVESSY